MLARADAARDAPPTYEVVVPTYAVESTIAATLTSLTEQTLAPERVLVADDETPDRSVEIAEGFPGVEVRRFPHSGLSGVQNRALAEVRAEAVAFVDADDLWRPATGDVLFSALASTDAAAVSVNFEPFPDGSLPTLDDPGPPVWEPVRFEDLIRYNTLRKAGTMYRTAALRDLEGWREDLPITGDYDIALRLLEAGHTIFSTSWRGFGYRTSSESMSRDPAPTLREALEVSLPRCAPPGAGNGLVSAPSQARTLWLRTLAMAAHDGRDLRDVPALSDLLTEPPPGQRALDLLAHSPLRHGLAAGWRAWRSR